MRLIKAESIGHFDAKKTRHAIYSIDFQPNGNRLATGGHDCTVKLWNTDALLQTGDAGGTGETVEGGLGAEENNAERAKAEEDCLLATLSNHTKSVNIVRWSCDGQYLASGSDDCTINVYRHTPGGYNRTAFGQAAKTKSWQRCTILPGHTMDGLDLDLSPKQHNASDSI